MEMSIDQADSVDELVAAFMVLVRPSLPTVKVKKEVRDLVRQTVQQAYSIGVDAGRYAEQEGAL
jgi:hypothetical protein